MSSILESLKRLIKNFFKRFTNPVVASKSYRYLARQVSLDLSEIEGGKSIVFSSSTSMDANNETLLMFCHFLRDELSSKVLIIDASFVNSGLTSLLNFKDSKGIIDLLSDSGEGTGIESFIHTIKENIFFIPLGDLSKQHLPFVTEEQVKLLLEQYKQEFDYVVIQQANIQLDTRYLLFAKSADLVLAHLEERRTPISTVDEAEDVFSEHQITNVKYILSEP